MSCEKKMGSWFEDSLAFYASYHHNETNKFIHILFVWPIFYTAQIFLQYLTVPVPAALTSFLPESIFSESMNSWAFLCSLMYAIYYFFIEQPGYAGPLAAGMVMVGFFITQKLVENFPSIWLPALILHAVSWVAQIYGHQVYEKRAPAFFDNLVQALVMAPLFVLLEVLFLLGYKPDLRKQVEIIAVNNIATFRKSQKLS
jgi:uncharacterized membrane protein YGL010W